MKILRSWLPLPLLVVAFGCAETKPASPPAQSPVPAVTAPANDANGAHAAKGPDASVDTQGLHVSDAIARACGLPKQEVKPSFEYDSTAIGEDDRAVLSAVARCLVEGPLKGSKVALTGRADPRGEDEYNMTLGEARADSVRRYLHDLGVQQDRLRATSRGEIDATGTSEDGWAHDRRVDIDLAN